MQDRSSHMPPPAPLGTGDASVEAARSTNSCSRRHGKIVLFILLCCNRASPPQFIRTAFHAYNSAKKTNNSCRSSGCSGSSSFSGPLRLLQLLELLWLLLLLRLLELLWLLLLLRLLELLWLLLLLRLLELLWAPLAVRAPASPRSYCLGKIFQILLNHTVPVSRV